MLKLQSLAETYAAVHLPSRVVLAITEKPDGSFNLITLEWFMRTSIQPPMFAISIGHSRYSYECLQDKRWFNLIFPSPQLRDLLNLAGSHSGRDIDKFTAGKVEYFPGKFRQLPILKHATAALECEVVSQIKSGDHTIFIGEVKYSWKDEDQELYYFK